MPTVLNTPDLCEERAVASLSAAPPYVQRVPTGRWQRLTQAAGRLYANRHHRLTYDGGVPRVPCETYQDRFARQQPYLYIYAYTIAGS